LLEVDEQEKMSFPGLIGSSTGPVLTGSSTGPGLIGSSTGPVLTGSSTDPVLIGSDRIVVASETKNISGLSSIQVEKIFDLQYSKIEKIFDLQYSKHEQLKLLLTFIDSHREGGTSCTPSKDFEKLDSKNAIKHENIRPPAPPRFSHKPQYPPQKNLKMTVHLC
jgi:hypothetical protein